MVTGNLLGVIDFLGCPESVALAREYVRRKLGSAHPALEDVTLLVSEVVTNAIVHSDSKDGGTVTLALADCHDFIHVDVVDAGGPSIPQMCGDPYAEGGRGLMLVDLISRKWAVYHDEAGRTVWFQVPYTRRPSGDVPVCPRQRQPLGPMTSRETATQRTASRAVRTVAQSIDLDRQQRHAPRLIDRWELDREGLDEATAVLGVPPLQDEEVSP